MNDVVMVDGLGKDFGAFTAVDSVDFTVPPPGDLRLPRPQRRRQYHHNQHAGRPSPSVSACEAFFRVRTKS